MFVMSGHVALWDIVIKMYVLIMISYYLFSGFWQYSISQGFIFSI